MLWPVRLGAIRVGYSGQSARRGFWGVPGVSGWLLEVATELNDRPRKTLGGITPAQEMQRLLSEPEYPIVATTG